MTREVWTLLLILLIGMAIHHIQIDNVVAEPRHLLVDDNGPADFSNIQDAIDAAQLGDIVSVQSGAYYENLVVSKSISILGENKSTTFIDGGNSGTRVQIISNETVVKGFTIMNGENGVTVTGSSNCTIEDNNVIGNTVRGILISRSENCIIRENLVSGSRSGYGINVNASRNILVENNGATHNYWDGIGLLSSINCTIKGNTISHNQVFGIWVDTSSGNTIYLNNFINNTFQASSNTPLNFWDNGAQGNYWAEYDGVDVMHGLYQNESGSDGIGDQPNIVDADTEQQDSYPLWLPNVNAIYLNLDTDPPVAFIDYDQSTYLEAEMVSFTALGSYDSAGNHTIVSYDWSFGDNTSAYGFSTNHTYTSPGNYTVSLSLTDIAGNQGSSTVQVHIQSKSQTEDSFGLVVIIGAIVTSLLVISLILWIKKR